MSSTVTGFRHDVLAGLGKRQKLLPPKYFYDDLGSRLFVQLTGLEEYYVTRIETELLAAHATEISQVVGTVNTLVELGGVSFGRTERLLHSLPSLQSYLAIDISKTSLEAAERLVTTERPELRFNALQADLSGNLTFPRADTAPPRLTFFAGSSIGNMDELETAQFLERLGRRLGGRLLLGVDRKKASDVLEAAYADREGVTAAFNLNLLTRINRELDANFELDAFAHQARYLDPPGRVEMHLVSKTRQIVSVAGHTIQFEAGESIHTENSYKYTIDEFQALAGAVGWSPERYWQDPDGYYSLHLLHWSD